MTELLKKLQWRYATKKMNPAQAVSDEKVDRLQLPQADFSPMKLSSSRAKRFVNK
jgi:hypothetical protein